MDKNALIKFREQLFEITGKYIDLIGDESQGLEKEYSIVSSDRLDADFREIADEGRLLQIGIVGRVKAGKSSLLNALLFDGNSVLPKAATPMTAALTVLSYGEELSAEVDFFTDEDIANIRADHDRYNDKLATLTQERLDGLLKRKNKDISEEERQDLRAKAERQAQRAMKEKKYQALSAAHEQYGQISKAGEIDRSQNVIKADTTTHLADKLLQYVSADGKFMPFTKSVHIKFPLDSLKDIRIIDTPGMNDPVQSREERTRDLLKYCDVVFIVSPSGQFLSNEDIELLDRVTSKEGVNELCVVASQVDNQLFGSEKEKHNGLLDKVLSGIAAELGMHMSETLSQLKKDSPEVGNTFDQLIKDGKERVLHSSGICQTIKNNFDDKGKLDDGARKVWENLTTEYPDYFSDRDKNLSTANLEKLANITQVHSLLETVRVKKEEILQQRKDEFVQVRFNGMNRYHDALVGYVKEQVGRIKHSDVSELKEQLDGFEKIENKTSMLLNEDYQDHVADLEISIRDGLSKTLNSYFKETRGAVNDSQGSETESYEVEKGGLLPWVARKTGMGGYETRTRTYTTVRAGAVRSSLQDLSADIENAIASHAQSAVNDWKKTLLVGVTKTLRANVDDDNLEPQLIGKAIRKVINSVKYPELEYSLEDKKTAKKDSSDTASGFLGLWRSVGAHSSSSSLMTASGTLSGSTAESFLDEARDYLTRLKKQVNKDIKNYLESLIGELKKLDLSSQIFGDYKDKIEALQNQIESRELILDRFNRLSKELEAITHE